MELDERVHSEILSYDKLEILHVVRNAISQELLEGLIQSIQAHCQPVIDVAGSHTCHRLKPFPTYVRAYARGLKNTHPSSGMGYR